MAAFNYFTFFCFLFVLLSSSSPITYRIRFVIVIFKIHDNYRLTLSTHHCLRVDPSTDLGLQGPVLQAATTSTSARPHANLISPFSSLCTRYVVIHTFCREARVINLCSRCFCFAVWQMWWHCKQIKDPGPISIRLFEGWNPCTCCQSCPDLNCQWHMSDLLHIKSLWYIIPLLSLMFVYHVIQTLLILHFTNSFLICRAWEPDYVTKMHWIRNCMWRQC